MMSFKLNLDQMNERERATYLYFNRMSFAFLEASYSFVFVHVHLLGLDLALHKLQVVLPACSANSRAAFRSWSFAI